MPLPSPPFPSLSAISHPTKVRWLLQEEGAPAPARGESGDHSAKYNTDEREREENVQNGQLQSRGTEQQGKALGHIYNAE